MNVNDNHHDHCKRFFEEHATEHFYFPIHSLFEVHASRSRRIKNGSFLGLPGTRTLRNQLFIDINRKLYDVCQRRGLFDTFARLKGSDLIYACLAKIGNFTLVTCDADFDAYQDQIRIVKPM
jgi:predicted nucleic acid-binding protein